MCRINAPGYMIPKWPTNVSRDLKRKVNNMTHGAIKEIPVSSFKVPMMILKGESQGAEQIRSLTQVKCMHIITPCLKLLPSGLMHAD